MARCCLITALNRSELHLCKVHVSMPLALRSLGSIQEAEYDLV